LDSKPFPVRVNLGEALFNLGDDAIENLEERMMWINAICIDQKNIPERNEQV
jgi:hypothetical protein